MYRLLESLLIILYTGSCVNSTHLVQDHSTCTHHMSSAHRLETLPHRTLKKKLRLKRVHHGFRGQQELDWVWNVMAHAQKPDFVFRAKRTSPLKLTRVSVQSTTGSRGVHISGSNAGYTMFRGSVKSTGYPLHSPVSLFTSPPVRHHVPSHFNWTLTHLSGA